MGLKGDSAAAQRYPPKFYLARTKLITFLTTQNANGSPITNTINKFKSVNKSPTYANAPVIKEASTPVIIVVNILLLWDSDLLWDGLFLNFKLSKNLVNITLKIFQLYKRKSILK